ncbi:MAG: TlpA disulfide reductase family protein [Pyrinomonadaceae bacterium]
MKYTLILLVTILSASIFSACNTGQNKSPEKTAAHTEIKRGTAPGQTAPDFELAANNGEKVSIAALKGKSAVLVFWSAYCSSCKEEAPKINQLATEFKDKGVEIVGINVGESVARTQEGIEDFEIKYTVARDEGAIVTKKYGVIGTPTVIFLDKKGVVRYNGNELPADYADQLTTINSEF